MRNFFKPQNWIAVLVFSLIFVSCSDDDGAVNPPTDSTSDIVDLVVANDSLTQLEAALDKAGLIETLKGTGPFTVFAPTDDAFVALLNALGDDYNSLDDFDTAGEIELLTNILLYHVLPLQAKSTDLTPGSLDTAYTDNQIGVLASGDTFVIGDAAEEEANLITVDVEATNGVVHIIDKVLLPQAAVDFVASLREDIVGVASGDANFSVLVDAVVKTGLVETLQSEGPLTVFAPTNDAFVALLNALGDDYNSLDDFDTADEIALLRNILLYHVLPLQAKSTDLMPGSIDTAYTGNQIGILASGDTFVIGDAAEEEANLITVDLEATNGVIHAIDKVLLPQAAVDFVASL